MQSILTASDIREVNQTRRAADLFDRKKWPVCGRFSVAERAIREARRLRREGLEVWDREAYECLLADIEARIVNNLI